MEPESPVRIDPAGIGEESIVPVEGASVPPWMEELPEGDIEFARNKGWMRPADLVREYRDLEAMVGPNQVRMPNSDTSPEEVDAFWSRLGRPAAPDGYSFSPGETATGYDNELAEWFREAAYAVNMPADMAHKLHDQFLQARLEQAAAHWQADRDRAAEAVSTLSQEWGSSYHTNLELARRAVAELGGPDLKEVLEETGLGDDPSLVRAFAAIGRRIYAEERIESQGDFEAAAKSQASDTPAHPGPAIAAQREILRLRSDDKFMLAYADRAHPSHEIAQAEMDALYAAAYSPNKH